MRQFVAEHGDWGTKASRHTVSKRHAHRYTVTKVVDTIPDDNPPHQRPEGSGDRMVMGVPVSAGMLVSGGRVFWLLVLVTRFWTVLVGFFIDRI